jgi:predicted nucleotide-binding protein
MASRTKMAFKPLDRLQLLEDISVRLQERYSTSDLNALFQSLGLVNGLQTNVHSKRLYSKQVLSAAEDAVLLDLATQLDINADNIQKTSEAVMLTKSSRTVFVIHGRNETLRIALFDFLRAAGLDPLEWSQAVQLTGSGAPYIGDVLERAFQEATAIVVLLTPDDEVRLSPDLQHAHDPADEKELRLQPRPNVIFEAGMAFGRHAERTVMVAVGSPKPFSDVAGRHIVHLTNDVAKRMDLLGRLKTAGCDVRTEERRDWITTGDFSFAPSIKISEE